MGEASIAQVTSFLYLLRYGQPSCCSTVVRNCLDKQKSQRTRTRINRKRKRRRKEEEEEEEEEEEQQQQQQQQPPPPPPPARPPTKTQQNATNKTKQNSSSLPAVVIQVSKRPASAKELVASRNRPSLVDYT